jgi:glycosyltransferase involved in cell wall biosynthesis
VLRQRLSVVIPVYRAGRALRSTVEEIVEVADTFAIAPGVHLDLDEVVLVCDNPGLPPEERDAVRALEELDPRISTVWLARNFGQHPATIAGIVSTNGDWVVTMDEDGQHDPRHIPKLLLSVAEANRPLAYAKPTNPPPHGPLRNVASRLAKGVFRRLSGAGAVEFHSFRMLEGPIGRAACAYVGENVYLDVALRWSCGDAALCPLPMREEDAQESSYDLRKLMSHFWRMVISSGTRPLRLIALGGLLVAFAGFVAAAFFAEQRLRGAVPVQGWASVIVSQLILLGGVLISLAVVAEYVGFAVRNAIGKPLYVTADHADSRALWMLQAALRRETQVPAPL